MDKTLLTQLINFGLSEKEAKIYTTLLEIDAATVFEVAKHSGVNRSSAYVVLETLQKKGFVGISDDKKVRRYIASSPEILLQSAKREARKYDEIKSGIESIVPVLKALHKNTKHKPIVKVFEGKDGLINLYEDSLSCKEKQIRIVSAVEPIYKLLPDYVPTYIKQRFKKGIKMFGIHPDHGFLDKYTKMDKKGIDDAVFIPADKYKTPADFAIYDNKIGYMTAEDDGFGVLIEDKDFARVMKSIFDLAYEEAKRLTNK